LSRDFVEIATRHLEPFRLQLPDALAAAAGTTHHARIGECSEMLGDRLPRHTGSVAQTRDGEWAVITEPGDETEAGPVTQRREDRSRIGAPGGTTAR